MRVYRFECVLLQIYAKPNCRARQRFACWLSEAAVVSSAIASASAQNLRWFSEVGQDRPIATGGMGRNSQQFTWKTSAGCNPIMQNRNWIQRDGPLWETQGSSNVAAAKGCEKPSGEHQNELHCEESGSRQAIA